MKRLAAVGLVLALVFSSAQGTMAQEDDASVKNIVLSKTVHELDAKTRKAMELYKNKKTIVIQEEPLYRATYKDGKMIIPKKDEIKKKLQERFKKKKRTVDMAEIDNIVDGIIKQADNTNNNNFQTQHFSIYPHNHYWYIEPTTTETTEMVAWANWTKGLDCYRSANSSSITLTKKYGSSHKLGFKGSNLIRKMIDVSYEYTHNFELSIGYTINCSAWTATDHRAYSRYYEDKWWGVYATETYYPNGNVSTQTETQEGTNKIHRFDSIDVWTVINRYQNINALTPIHPDNDVPPKVE